MASEVRAMRLPGSAEAKLRQACTVKPRHAAALALVGWYLMTPPTPNNDPDQFSANAPLSSWVQVGSYNSLEDCKNEQKGWIRTALKHGDVAAMAYFGSWQCITGDDLRLAK